MHVYVPAYLLALVLALVGAGAPPAVHAQAQSVHPGINQSYERDPDFEQWRQRFERPGREVYDKRHDILAASGVQRGMTVADIGAGTGLFTRLFAEAVGPDGRVYAVDIARSFVDNIVRTSRAQGLDNVIGVVNDPKDVGLDDQSIDLAFLSDTYHHFEFPQLTLGSIHRALRPGGAMIVIDFQRIEGQSSSWVLGHVRAGKETVIDEIEAAGFKFAGEETMLRDNYFLRFRKVD